MTIFLFLYFLSWFSGTINGLVVDEKNGLLMLASAEGSIRIFSIESSIVQRTRSSIEPPTPCAVPPFNELDLVNIVLLRRTQIEESKLEAEVQILTWFPWFNFLSCLNSSRYSIENMLSVQFIIFSTAGLCLRYPYGGNDPVPKTFLKCELLIIIYMRFYLWNSIFKFWGACCFQDLRVKLELEHEDILQQEQLNEQRRALAIKRKDEEHAKAEKELYNKAQLSEKRIQMAESDKEATLQSLMSALALNMKEMRNYYEDKVHLSFKPVVVITNAYVRYSTCSWTKCVQYGFCNLLNQKCKKHLELKIKR